MQGEFSNEIEILETAFKECDIFLQNTEKKLTGNIIKVPIEPDIWQSRAEHTMQVLKNFTKYSKAASPEYRGKKYYSECIEEIASKQAQADSDSCQKSTAEDWLLGNWHINQTPLDVLKLFLDSQYEPPACRANLKTLASPFNLQVHLLAYMIYQKYIVLLSEFFYPTVNERINFAGVRLIGTVSALVPFMLTRGKAIDGSKKGGGESKIDQAILEATIRFIKEKPDRITKTAEEIYKAFKRRYSSEEKQQEIFIKNVDFGIFCKDKEIFAKAYKDKKTPVKTITLNTFKNIYISRAKKEIKSHN